MNRFIKISIDPHSGSNQCTFMLLQSDNKNCQNHILQWNNFILLWPREAMGHIRDCFIIFFLRFLVSHSSILIDGWTDLHVIFWWTLPRQNVYALPMVFLQIPICSLTSATYVIFTINASCVKNNGWIVTKFCATCH